MDKEKRKRVRHKKRLREEISKASNVEVGAVVGFVVGVVLGIVGFFLRSVTEIEGIWIMYETYPYRSLGHGLAGTGVVLL
ncbi:hypothetical protein ACFLXE_03070 [Chloroflexota bacterium]